MKRWLRSALGYVAVASSLISMLCYIANERLAEDEGSDNARQ